MFTAPGNRYWAVQVVNAYQGPNDVDHDPDGIYHAHPSPPFQKNGEEHRLGQAPIGDEPGYDNFVIVFQEVVRDYSAWTQWVHQLVPSFEVRNAGDIERITVAHELGHVFGLPHVAGTSIMEVGVDDSATEFTDSEIAQIRASTVIGGE